VVKRRVTLSFVISLPKPHLTSNTSAESVALSCTRRASKVQLFYC
jgi:hypothetical protein